MQKVREVACKFLGEPKIAIKNLLTTIVGCLLIGLAIHAFYTPTNLQMGGFSGLALVITKATGWTIPIGTLSILLNIPLLAAVGYFINKRFLIMTVIGMLILGYAVDLTQSFGHQFNKFIYPLGVPESDYFLMAVFGGILFGLGAGLVIRAGYATGGSDVFAFLVRLVLRSANFAMIVWAFDTSVIIAGAYFDHSATATLRIVMYSLVALLLEVKTIDMVLSGYSFKRVAYVISSNPQAIADAVMHKLKRGVTGLKAVGHYRNSEIEVLMVVLDTKQVPQLKTLISEVDEKAFVFVMDSREVSGEGFAKHNF